MDKFYKTGEVAKLANLTIRTIRYYDQIDLLKPSKIDDNGYRLYTPSDLIKLQKITSLKQMGFSLENIKSMTISDSYLSLQKALRMQKDLVDKQIENLKVLSTMLDKLDFYLENNRDINWENIIHEIQFINMEQNLLEQYENSNNIDIRIHLHEKYSINPLHWFDWLKQNYELDNKKILEVGCGNGKLWMKDASTLRYDLTLSDISSGMLLDAKKNLKEYPNIKYQVIDCNQIPYEDECFDEIIANHVLFYVNDIHKALKEIKRVLKKGGILYCTTYGNHHMREITDLIQGFNTKINLSNINLYDIFGLENGKEILDSYFKEVTLLKHEDYLEVTNYKDLMDYILSCHGNQKEYILSDYDAFNKFIKKKVGECFRITKDAGVFVCRK